MFIIRKKNIASTVRRTKPVMRRAWVETSDARLPVSGLRWALQTPHRPKCKTPAMVKEPGLLSSVSVTSGAATSGAGRLFHPCFIVPPKARSKIEQAP